MRVRRTDMQAGGLFERHALLVLWVAVGIAVAGQLLDLRWHLTHDEFETASDQLRAHWLSWVGALALLAVAARGSRRAPPGSRRVAYVAVAVAAAVYLAAATWHFVEHSRGSDPAVAHIVIAAAKSAALAGVIAVTVIGRRRPEPA